MQRLRGIADVDLVARDAGATHLECERLHGSLLHPRAAADCSPSRGVELREKLSFIGCGEALSPLRPHAPYEGITSCVRHQGAGTLYCEPPPRANARAPPPP